MFALTKRVKAQAALRAELEATTPDMITVVLYNLYLEVTARSEESVTYTVYDLSVGYTEEYDFTVLPTATGGEVLEAYRLFTAHQ